MTLRDPNSYDPNETYAINSPDYWENRWARINQQYQTLLGRNAHRFEMVGGGPGNHPGWNQLNEHHTPVRSISQITSLVSNSDERYRRLHYDNIPFTVDRQENQTNPQHFSFGIQDYTANLEAGGEYDARSTRQSLVAWLTNPNTGYRWLNPEDRQGDDSLLSLIQTTSDQPGAEITPAWGESPEIFGRADLLATRAMGYSESEIQSWLDEQLEENPAILRDRNQPGRAGGVYEAVRSGTPLNTSYPTPNVTESDVQPYWVREPNPILPEERDSLTINPGSYLLGTGQLKPESGDVRRRIGKPRPKYTSTKDLSREMRNSLNIS